MLLCKSMKFSGKYLMRTKFLDLLVVIAFAMTLASSCNKHHSSADPKPEIRKEPLVMTYEDFITPSDVQILSSDSTRISVSKAYVEKMGITDFKDRAVTIWRTIGTIPFVRIIKDSKVENDKVILTTERGDFCDMFENLDISLETNLYVDRDYVPALATRSGSTLEVEDVSGKYQDDAGVYHPAVIIFDEDSPALKGLQTKTGETKNYFTAEELLADNFSFDLINVNSDFILDYAYPKTDEDKGVADSDAKIHVRGKVGVNAKLSSYINVNISWFKLKKFEVGFKGNLGLAAKVNVGVEKKLEYKWEQKLAELGYVTSVFWIGIIPVPYSVETTIKEKIKAMAQASIAVYTTAKYDLGFEKGILYTSSDGWKNTSKENTRKGSFNLDGLKGSGRLEASAGTFVEVAVKFGFSAGPTFSFGPKLSAEAEASAGVDLHNNIFEGKVGAYVGLSGELGTKVDILGYTLAKWTTTFDLFKITLFSGSFKYTYSDEEWNNLQAEWTTIAEKHSSQWEWSDRTNSPSIPYRLPDIETNL